MPSIAWSLKGYTNALTTTRNEARNWCERRGTRLLVREHDACGLCGALECSAELPQVLHVQRHLIRALLIACHGVESCDKHYQSVCHFCEVSQCRQTHRQQTQVLLHRFWLDIVETQVGSQTGRRELDLDELAAIGDGRSCGVLCQAYCFCVALWKALRAGSSRCVRAHAWQMGRTQRH